MKRSLSFIFLALLICSCELVIEHSDLGGSAEEQTAVPVDSVAKIRWPRSRHFRK